MLSAPPRSNGLAPPQRRPLSARASQRPRSTQRAFCEMDETIDPDPLLAPVEIRKRLFETLELDLVGPWPGHELAEERLPRRVRPSNWYLTGFLIPVDADEKDSGDDDADDEFEADTEGAGDESIEERVAAKKAYF